MARLLADANREAGTPAVYNSSAILHDTNHLRGLSAMRNLYHSLLLVIATATQEELARHVRYLKAENEILRSKLPARVPVTAKERNRLVRFADKLGRALDQLTTIVHPDTLRRWIRESKSARRASVKGDGKRTAVDLRKLILRLARENPGWGYTRIVGELKKLGIKPPSRGTVRNILREHGLDPAPTRGDSTWDEFLKLHAATLWQADFLSVRSLTTKGVRQLFLLVFLHVETRRVFITRSTANPTESWVLQQARARLRHFEA